VFVLRVSKYNLFFFQKHPKKGICKKELRLEDIKRSSEHEHIYVEKGEFSLKNFFSPKSNSSLDPIHNIRDDIRRAMAKLAGKDGLSFRQLTSNNLWELIFLCMNEMNEVRKIEERVQPESVIKKPTRKGVSRVIHEEAEKELIKLRSEKFHGEYLTLAFDGGSFKGRDYYVGVAYVPYKACSPLIVCFEQSVKTQEDFARTFAATLSEVWKFAEVSCVVVDGLRHQAQAMTLFPTSDGVNYQELLDDKQHALPFLLPDVPHLLQLMLTHAKNNPTLELNKIISGVDSIGTEIRKRTAVNAIGGRCPTYPTTRFFYIVPKMKFIIDKRELIYNYYQRYLCYILFYF
jgi:hypothetical protein